MNLQSFVATTAAVTLGLAAIGAGALAVLRDRPAPPSLVASVEPPPAPEAQPPRPPDVATPPAAPSPAAPSQAAAPPRRQLAQAAPHRRPVHEHLRPVRAVRAGGPADEPRQVVVVPPGYYPAYAWRPSASYYRAW